MIVNIVPIGNSKGIRIPKSILKQCNIQEKVQLGIENGKIILEPLHNNPRADWSRSFKNMAENAEDELIVADFLDEDNKDWEW